MIICSLSTGKTTTSTSAVNCEDAVRIRKEIQKVLQQKTVAKTGIDLVQSVNTPVVVVAQDSDILVLL